MTNKITAIGLMALVLLDVFGIYPQLQGVSYHLFNLPSRSYQEKILWSTLLFIAVSHLIGGNKFSLRILRRVGMILSVAILTVCIYKFIFSIIFILSDRPLVINAMMTSLYADIKGRFIGLIVLMSLVFTGLSQQFMNRKY